MKLVSPRSERDTVVRNEMALSASNSAIWEEIELSESYLVCSMYEKAVSIAYSVLRNLCQNELTEAGEDTQLNDMLESAGMVLVQSLKELGRTQEILNELKLLFGFVTSIPVQVFLASVCFQISEGPSSSTREFLELFLSKWRYVDERHYVLVSAESNVGYMERSSDCVVLGVDKYLEVVDVYVISLLGLVLRDINHAISWVEKAALPEEKRQELLRRLHSLYSPNAPESSQGSVAATDKSYTHSSSLKDQNTSAGSQKALIDPWPLKGESDMKQTILKLSQQRVPCFWWFRTVTLRFGNCRLVVSNGKIVLGCLMILMYYFLKRKKAALKGVLRRQAVSMKKALVDLWQLMFSYQVNPLAAVQPLPATTHGSR